MTDANLTTDPTDEIDLRRLTPIPRPDTLLGLARVGGSLR